MSGCSVDQLRQAVAACEIYLTAIDRLNTLLVGMTYEEFAAFALSADSPLPPTEDLIDAGATFLAMAKITAQLTTTIDTRRSTARTLN